MRQDIISPLKNLSKYGWYISGLMTAKDSINFGNDADNNKMSTIDRKLTNYYNRNFKQAIDEIIRNHPERRKIIMEATKAHHQRMYFASTSLFLSQADGICNGFLFRATKQKKNLKKVLSKSTYFDEILSVITEESTVDSYHGSIKKSDQVLIGME